MIIDSLDNLEKYSALHPSFPKAISYIKSLNVNDLETGKFELDGENLFVMVSDSELHNPEEVRLEAHNKYIDIQVPFSKAEIFGWSPRSTLTKPVGTFDTSKDILFFEDKHSTQFTLNPDNFVIFFPQDAHAPCIGEGNVIKMVVKIKI